jgi:hypothetical protein
VTAPIKFYVVLYRHVGTTDWGVWNCGTTPLQMPTHLAMEFKQVVAPEMPEDAEVRDGSNSTT